MFYGSAAGFITYHEGRGKTIPGTWDTERIEQALLVASEWLDDMYDNLWYGYATDGFEQERKWPREVAKTNTFPQYVFTNTQIPNRVVSATYEAAFKECTAFGSLNVDFTPNKYNSVSIDNALSVEYAKNQTIQDVQVQIRIIDSLMQPLIDPSNEGSKSSLSGASNRE